jgi:hypothetical protein
MCIYIYNIYILYICTLYYIKASFSHINHPQSVNEFFGKRNTEISFIRSSPSPAAVRMAAQAMAVAGRPRPGHGTVAVTAVPGVRKKMAGKPWENGGLMMV